MRKSLKYSITWLGFVILSACAKSGKPVVVPINPISTPVFTGTNSSNMITVYSTSATLNGTCDVNSLGLEYSIDNQVTWSAVNGGCSGAGTFTFDVSVSVLLLVHVRGVGYGYKTASSNVTVQYIQVATDASFAFAGAAHTEDDGPQSLQSTLGLSISGESLSDAATFLHSFIPAIFYEN